MYLSALTANAIKSADKLADTLNNALTGSAKSPQQGNMSNLLSGAEGSAKAESVFKSFELGGKDAASIARLSGSSGDEFSQLKLETGAGQASREGNSSKDASTLYAQTVQTLHSSTGAGPAQETVPVSRLTSMDEVISKAVDAGQKNLVIRIDPPDLGNVQIRLSLDNGVLKAEVRVDSSIVKDAFNLVIPQIKTSLENSGIKVSEFHVDVRDDQNGNGQANNDNNKQKQRQDGEARNAFSGFFA
jgi:flagellar hook-length control protein FliK